MNSPDRDNVHNLYFNKFTRLWNGFLANGNFDEAARIWQTALEPLLAFEAANPPREPHKDTGFYFWGMTSIIRGDLDKGYGLVHQAVEEDVATMNVPYSDTADFIIQPRKVLLRALTFTPPCTSLTIIEPQFKDLTP